MKARLVVRADATMEIGAGHVMRCLTIAETWMRQGYGAAVVWGQTEQRFVVARAAKAGVEIGVSGTMRADDVLLVDHYDPAVRANSRRAPAGLRVLVDDLGATVGEGFHAVLNPNAYAVETLYPGITGRFLGGPEFIPVRKLPRWSPNNSRRVAVFVGGSPISDRMRESLLELQSAAPAHSFFSPADLRLPRFIRIDSNDPWVTVAECQVLITTAGSTVWEAASVGIPAIVIPTADNQQMIAEWAERYGAPVVHLTHSKAGAELVAALSRASVLPRVEDGSLRIVHALTQMYESAVAVRES